MVKFLILPQMYIEKDFFTIKNDTSNKKKRSTHHYFSQMKQKCQKTYGGPFKKQRTL